MLNRRSVFLLCRPRRELGAGRAPRRQALLNGGRTPGCSLAERRASVLFGASKDAPTRPAFGVLDGLGGNLPPLTRGASANCRGARGARLQCDIMA